MFRYCARPMPTRRGSRCVPPPPGMSPSLISGCPSVASSAATRMSQHIASSSPPPRQKPWIAATNGVRAASMRWPSFWIPRAEPRSCVSAAASRREGNSLMSAPATNARSPAPTSTIARTSSSASRRSISDSSSSSSAAERALTGGLSIVTTATAPSVSVEMYSPTSGCLRGLGRLRGELLAQRGLAELPDRRLRDLVHELEPLREPPLREARREEVAQLVGGGLLALAQYDDGERPLRPLLVRNRDDGRLHHRRMAHERVLESHRRDPLAARLHEVLRAVLYLDEAVGMDGHDVARPEPAVVRPAVGAVVGFVVRGCDRRTAYLELAHRLSVPGHEPLGAARADLDERDRDALHGAPRVGLLRLEAGLLTRSAGQRPHRAHLRHPPTVREVEAV